MHLDLSAFHRTKPIFISIYLLGFALLIFARYFLLPHSGLATIHVEFSSASSIISRL
jgi:hypothetical protein